MQIDVADFGDYRSFLATKFGQLKSKKPRSVSFESMARKVKSSKTFVRLVLTKKRHISLHRVTAFAKAFEISDDRSPEEIAAVIARAVFGYFLVNSSVVPSTFSG